MVVMCIFHRIRNSTAVASSLRIPHRTEVRLKERQVVMGKVGLATRLLLLRRRRLLLLPRVTKMLVAGIVGTTQVNIQIYIVPVLTNVQSNVMLMVNVSRICTMAINAGSMHLPGPLLQMAGVSTPPMAPMYKLRRGMQLPATKVHAI